MLRSFLRPAPINPQYRAFSATTAHLSGHNRWSKIKHDKGKADALKNRQRSIFAQEIATASKLFGPDINSNPKLADLVTKAKKAIAGFKIREGQAIGTMVTLRGARMYEFLDRFVTVALPRVRDFRGVPGNRGFDGRGNYALGLKEQIVFPEINYDKVDAIRGMDIVFVTTAKTDKEAKALLKGFDLPFVN